MSRAGISTAIPVASVLPWFATGWRYRVNGPGDEYIDIDPRTNTGFMDATVPTPRDPLAIDLDADSIETVGIPATGNPILFDHDADGVRTGTGWLQGDDGWLVRDLNGNGLIDSGRELFGVDTRIVSTDIMDGGGAITRERNAYSGFDALRVLDSGAGDGVIDANAPAFAELKIWRDLNQDGITQTGELQSLATAGVASISLQATPTNTNLGNGNSVTATATVTRSNGAQTQVAGVGLNTAGNLELADNPFYRTFTDTIPLTEAARALPEMGGSGWVRDLREAMSLPAGSNLAAVVQQFAAAGTRDAQLALIDSLLTAWAGSSGRLATAQEFELVYGVVINETAASRTVRYTASDRPTQSPSAEYVVQYRFADPAFMQTVTGLQGITYQTLNAEGTAWLARRNVLEVFNGQRFFSFDSTGARGGGGAGSSTGGGGAGGVASAGPIPLGAYTFNDQQVDLIDQAYDALRESAYQALVLQTRLAKYLNVIELQIDQNGVRFDTAPMAQLLQATHAADNRVGLEDLAELLRYAQPTLDAVGYDGMVTLRQWVEALPAGSTLLANLQADGLLTYGPALDVSGGNDVYLGDGTANVVQSGAGADVLDGGAGNDRLSGQGDGDFLYGRGGDDTLEGGDGNDVLSGGAGNDSLDGGKGDDLFVFGRGDGQDVILDDATDSTAGKLNTLRLKPGVAPTDLVLRQNFNNGWGAALDVAIAGTTDKVTIGGFFYFDNPQAVYNGVQRFAFEDGTVWDLQTIIDKTLAGNADGDVIQGTLGNDTISGGEGADRLRGAAGNDAVDGGNGDDVLEGGDGNDVLSGGAGNDSLAGGKGDDLFVFGRGDGQDVILDDATDSTAGKLNTLRLKPGVAPTDLVLRQNFNNGWGAALDVAIAGTTDKVTIGGFFYFDNPQAVYNGVQRFAFEDGTVWDLQTIIDKTLAGNADGDVIQGTLGNDTISGGEGADRLRGAAGNDAVDGGNGDDVLEGGDGNDVLSGGAGNDSLAGGKGDDLFVFGRGDGQDVVLDDATDSTAGKLNTLRLKPGVAPTDLVLRQNFNNGWGAALDVAIAGTTDKVTINGFFFFGDIYNTYNAVQRIEFADGTLWDRERMRLETLRGSVGADDLRGFDSDDVLRGLAGNDRIAGGAGNDNLEGGDGDDTLDGGSGNDWLDGGAGIDQLTGGEGNDTYRWGRGSGNDRITEHVNLTNPGSDVLELVGLNPGDLQFYRDTDGNALITIVDTGETLQIDTQFRSGWDYTWIESLRFVGGTVWTQSQWSAAAMLTGTAGADTLAGSTENELIDARGGNDVVYGRAGSDTLIGGEGNDSLYGEAGDDILLGGAGNDLLDGGTGNNTYRFARGDGQDTLHGVNDAAVGKLNRIDFAAGIAASDLQLSRESGGGDNLIVKIAGGTDQITVRSFFSGVGPSNDYNPLQQLRFADGSTWDLAAIVANVQQTSNQVPGSQGNDTLTGTAGADTLDSGAGDDILRGLAGGDILIGGSGNDSLQGGTGNNTYVFGRGDGQDIIAGDYDVTAGKLNTIELKAGVGPTDVVLKRVYDSGYESLELSIAGTSDKVTARYAFSGDDLGNPNSPVQQIRFADGTSWDLAAIKAKVFEGTAGADTTVGTTGADVIFGQAGADMHYGRAGNDTLIGGADNDALYGDAGSDTLDGGAGNDRLEGGAGSDVYRFGRGSGADLVVEYDKTPGNADEVILGDAVARDQVWLRRVGYDLELSLIGTDDKITLAGWYYGSAYRVETLRTTSGAVLLESQVESLVSAMAGFSPPAAGQTTLPPTYQTALLPMITQAWQI